MLFWERKYAFLPQCIYIYYKIMRSLTQRNLVYSQYDGDKWDNFYEKIPISLLHHTNGNAIYNTSHPLMERLVGQLEIEAPCPYNS